MRLRCGVVPACFALVAVSPSIARAHPQLEVERQTDGTLLVACGPSRTMEPPCDTEGAGCMAVSGPGECLRVANGRLFCLNGDDHICCVPGDNECPAVPGFEAHCVPISSTDGVTVLPGAALCVYDPEGTSTCAERVAADVRVGLACQQAGGSPVLPTHGDCDLDGMRNIGDPDACGPPDEEVDAGTDAGTDTTPPGLSFAGGGGCRCAPLRHNRAPLEGVLGVAIAIAIRRCSSARRSPTPRRGATPPRAASRARRAS
jgi:hypothetical protein